MEPEPLQRVSAFQTRAARLQLPDDLVQKLQSLMVAIVSSLPKDLQAVLRAQ